MSVTPSTQPRQNPSYSGFALLVATMALLLSLGAVLAVAFRLDSSSNNFSSSSMPGSMMGTTGSSGSGSGGGHTEEVNLIVKSDDEHAKRGPEGTWHDAFLPADFSVQPGATVKVTVLNYDEGPHSFTSSQLGTNVTIAAGSPDKPTVTTFTFRAPTKAGSYLWYCALPCDPWAMSHNGYMRGDVTVA